MKKVNFLCLIVLGVFFSACHSDEETWGDWSKENTYPGDYRVSATSFQYGNDVYVGLGYNSEVKGSDKYLNSFYKFDGKNWESVTDSFPDKGREGCASFVIGDTAYVGAGYRAKSNGEPLDTYYSDFYKFDLKNGRWAIDPVTKKALKTDIAPYVQGDEKVSCKFWAGIAFEYNGKGYVGTGEVNGRYSKSIFSYNPKTGTWSLGKGMKGDPRAGGVVFKLGTTVVVCLGTDGSKNNVGVEVFDGTWESKEPIVDRDGEWNDDYSGIARSYAVAFTSDLDYGLCGYIAGGSSNTVWRYSLDEDRWHEVEHFSNAMSPRVGGVGFSIGGIGYITTGGNSLRSANNNTTWKFTPGIEEEDFNDYK